MKTQKTYDSQTAKFIATVCQNMPELSGDIMQGWIENPKGLKKFLKGLYPSETVGKLATQTEFLRLISEGKELMLGACDGTDIIPGSNDMFEAGIDLDFVRYGADEKGSATGETKISVYELIKDANFVDVFGSLGDIIYLCLTQHQIKDFIKKHRKWLKADGCATIFPFKSRNQLFVASVYVYSDGVLRVDVDRFEDPYVWRADFHRRVVFPKLA